MRLTRWALCRKLYVVELTATLCLKSNKNEKKGKKGKTRVKAH